MLEEGFRRQLLMDGQYNQLVFIATQVRCRRGEGRAVNLTCTGCAPDSLFLVTETHVIKYPFSAAALTDPIQRSEIADNLRTTLAPHSSNNSSLNSICRCCHSCRLTLSSAARSLRICGRPSRTTPLSLSVPPLVTPSPSSALSRTSLMGRGREGRGKGDRGKGVNPSPSYIQSITSFLGRGSGNREGRTATGRTEAACKADS